MAQMHRLVSTETGQAVIPELLQEVNEVVGMMFPGQSNQIKVSVIIGVEPVNLTVTIQLPSGILSITPQGITTVYTAQHSLDKQQWQFAKEIRAQCLCGQLLGQTDSLAALKDQALVHQQQAIAVSGNPDVMDAFGPGSGAAVCVSCCEAWRACSIDMVPEDKMKALLGMIAASIAGYSDPAVWDLGLNDEVSLAFEEVSKAVLEDESLFSLTAFVRPVRPAPDAEAQAKLAPWARAATCLPLTPWALAQPWYLQYTASRDHPGVQGAETCLPARRAASRVRSEFPEMDAYDALPYDEQADAVPPQVTREDVAEKLALVLQRSGDWRTPEQFARRLCISIPQFADLVNLKEIGSLAIDMCCRCGIFVLDAQPAVACEHCVDVYHLQCQGLKAVPEGEWVCPGCTLASGATGKAAAAAAALGRSKGPLGMRPGRGDRPRSRAGSLTAPSPRAGSGQRNGRESPTPRGSLTGEAPTGGGRGGKRAAPGAGTTPFGGPGALPPPVKALPQGTIFKQEFSSEDEPEDDGAISDGGVGGGGGGPPNKRQRTSGNLQRRGSQRSRYGIFRVDPADAALYTTNCPGMPQPNADGRSLVLRIATVLLARQVAPASRRWRPQVMLQCNMVAGIHCEYHHHVVSEAPRVTLSEATLVHGGIRCNRCRRAVSSTEGVPVIAPPPPAPDGASTDAPATISGGLADGAPPIGLLGQPSDMQVDALGDGAPNTAPKIPVPPPPQPPPATERVVGPLTDCGQVFKRFVDFEKHLRSGTTCPPCHIWLPKHRLYLQGVPGIFKGLAELAREETTRNPSLQESLNIATQVAEEARRRRIEEGRDPESSDNDESTAMPPPPPKGAGMSNRQRSAQQAAADRKSRAADKDAAQPQGNATAGPAAAAAKPMPPRPVKKETVPVLAGFDPESVQRQQARVKALMAVRLSEARLLAALPRPPLAAAGGPAVGPVKQDTEVAVKAEPPQAEDGAVHGTHSELLQLVQVEGTQQFTLVPKDALDAALSTGDGSGGADGADVSMGSATTGIPSIPASLLPHLLSAGGSVVPTSANGTAGTSAKVHSLKLLRRLTAVGGACEGGAEAGLVLQGLKACRDAANTIQDAQVQLESMGFIGELVTRLEGAVGPGGEAGKLPALLTDVQELRSQLEEWAGPQGGNKA